MLLYENYEFDLCYDLYLDDNSEIVTCRMCHEDCELSCFVDGCCPDCFSLCASVPSNNVDAYTRRAHLVTLTRKAFLAYSEAASLFQERVTALRPSRECIEEADLLAKHRLRRYCILESRLADESGLSKSSVYNSINAQWPLCSRLLRAGL